MKIPQAVIRSAPPIGVMGPRNFNENEKNELIASK